MHAMLGPGGSDLAPSRQVIDRRPLRREGSGQKAMTAYDESAQRYIDTWNQTDPHGRSPGPPWISFYAEDARYVDPLGVGGCREAIASMIDAVQQQFPGFEFRLAGPVDGTTTRPGSAGSWGPPVSGPDRGLRCRCQ